MKLNIYEKMIQRKREQGTLYYTSVAGNPICHACCFRGAFTNFCRRFGKSIKKVGQRNGGFHHIPCEECLAHVVDETDMNYFKRNIERTRKRGKNDCV